jgi:hypothetical protein
MEQLPLEVMLIQAANTVPNENPLSFFHCLYKTIHPGAISCAIQDAKALLKNENVKNGKLVNCYLVLGSDGFQKSMYQGAISAILSLNDFIDRAAVSLSLDNREVEICKKVLRACSLPSLEDIGSNNPLSDPNFCSCRQYAFWLSYLVNWLTKGIDKFKCKGAPRTNMELSRFLTATALETFPSIPFAAYYIDTVKTKDMLELTERLSKTFNFTEYMSDKCLELNQPRFIVQTRDAPLIGIAGHPLANIVYGQIRNDNVEWFGTFQQSEEFNKICLAHNLPSKEVQSYILQTGWDQHLLNLKSKTGEEKEKIARFVESQHFTKEAFEVRHSNYGIETPLNSSELEELLKDGNDKINDL